MYFLWEFDALSRQFLWSGNLSTSKWSLVKWETVCRPQKEGGLGLRSAILNGQVLAAKLYWRWCTNQHQLWARILTHKYFPDIDVVELPRFPLEGRGSMIWNTLKFGAQLVKDGLFWICHSGSQALFWLDSWDGHPPILSTHPQLHALYQIFSAAGWDTVDLYKTGCVRGLAPSFRWKHPSEWPPGGSDENREELFQILQSWECTTLVGNDVLAWDNKDLSGKFSVSSGYAVLLRQTLGDIQVPWWKQVWYKFSWPKCNFFMWLVVHSRCLTWDNLCKRGFHGPSMCVLCQTSEENISHLFFQCSYTRHIWHSSWNVWNQSCWHVTSLVEFFARLDRAPVKTSFLQVAWTLGPSFIIWHIWLERNRRIFKDECLEVPHLWWKILHSLGDTVSAKCDTSEAMEPREDIFNNRLYIPPSHGKLLHKMCRHPLQKINRVGKWSAPP